MTRRKLTASMDTGETITIDTITEGRRWAESYGNTAKSCTIYCGLKIVARHVRDTNRDGYRWFKAAI